MPRKMSGSAMRTMEASIVAINMPSVVMNSAVHLWRSLTWAVTREAGARSCRPRSSGPRARTFSAVSDAASW